MGKGRIGWEDVAEAFAVTDATLSFMRDPDGSGDGDIPMVVELARPLRGSWCASIAMHLTGDDEGDARRFVEGVAVACAGGAIDADPDGPDGFKGIAPACTEREAIVYLEWARIAMDLLGETASEAGGRHGA